MFCRPIALIVLLLAAFQPAIAAGESRPNVLFIICDDLNCDLGCYGDERIESPNIDRLAGQGVRFDRAYCQFPLCGPSRASFMTSLYPDQTLVKRNALHIREHLPNVRTMSQMFRDAGYIATRIGKIYHYNVPLHIGTSGHDDPYSWDITVNPRGRDVIEQDKIFSLVPGTFGGALSWLSADGTDREQTDGIAADEAIKRLKGYGKSQENFFMAVGLYRPHTPYVAPHDYFRKYPAAKIEVPKVPAGYLDTIPPPAAKSVRAKKHQVDLEDDLARQAIQAYHATITFADAQIGRILDALEETGLNENTVVVFTSDHGYHMGEHGHWQKSTLFENATRVPLIIAGPGVDDRGGVASEPVEMIDFYPTLADLCGLKAPGTVQGDSLAGILKDTASEESSSALSQFGTGYSLRTARYRYTEWGENGEEGKELYDHQTDPQELNNIANDEASRDVINRLAEELHARVDAAREQPKGLTQIKYENRRRIKK